MSEHGKGSSRRALLMAVAAGAAALAAVAVGAGPAEAAGTPLILASSANTASSPTGLEVTGTAQPYGLGVTDNGLGVAPAGTPAILGHANSQAFKAGVMGYATESNADGVYGLSLGGTGVHGVSDVGLGVRGESAGGVAVHGIGSGPGSVGVVALAGTGAIALDVGGPAHFTGSGVATVAGTAAAPKSSVKVANVQLSPESLVLATLQQVSGSVTVKAVVPNIPANTFTIYLTKAVTTSVMIGWFIVN